MDATLAVTRAAAGGMRLPLPLIGVLAVGIPLLIAVVLFVKWND